jgi:hypothetical protein
MSEAELQSAILAYLRAQPDFHPIRILIRRARGRTNSGTAKGVSDVVGVGPLGKFYAVEAKTPNGMVSDEQADFLALVNRLGGYGIVARSLEDVREMVRKMRTAADRRSA